MQETGLQAITEAIFDRKRQYKIPVYQRNYDWDKDNCKELFDDILEAYDRNANHFTGFMILVDHGVNEGSIREYTIVDGQQRITTVYLLMKALYDCATDRGTKETLQDYIFNFADLRTLKQEERYKLKLKPIKSDSRRFELLMNDRVDEVPDDSKIKINYNYFLKLIKDAESEGYTVKNITYALKKVIILFMTTNRQDDPQTIFERINSTGQKLKVSDLFRNFLLMAEADMDELYNNYWRPTEEGVGRDNMEDYILTYLKFKLSTDVKKDSRYNDFKRQFRAKGYTHEEILQDLKRYSKYYIAFTEPESEKSGYSPQVRYILRHYKTLHQTTIFPFFFSVFDDFENGLISEEILIKVLSLFLNYTVRRLTTRESTNALRGLYLGLYEKVFKEGRDFRDKNQYYENIVAETQTFSGRTAFPRDEKFKERLLNEDIYRIQNLPKLLLDVLENGLYLPKEGTYSPASSIEHILPQNQNSRR